MDQSEEPVSKQRIIEPTDALTGATNIPSVSSTAVVVKSEPNAAIEDMGIYFEFNKYIFLNPNIFSY